MRIVLSLLDLTAGKGGAERVGAELANEMTRRGHEVFIHCDTESNAPPSYRLEPGIQIIRQRLTADRLHEIRKAIVALDPDVYFIFYFNAKLLLQYAVAADSGIPLGAQECTNPYRAVGNLLSSGKFDGAPEAFRVRESILAGVHGIRLTLDSYLDSLHPIARRSAVAFPNAFAPARQRSNPGEVDGRKTILCVGGLKSPNKNGLVLAHAFARIAERCPDWDLRFVGQREHPKVPSILAETGLADRITLVGSTDEIYGEYERAQLHVICSFEEGLPNTVCEAMLHGLPSIGFSDCRGVNEVVKSGVTGLLVDRRDEVANLADGLSLLMGDPELRTRMGNSAFRLAADYINRAEVYDRWESLFRHIASYRDDCARLLDEQREVNSAKADQCDRVRKRLLSAANADSDEVVVANPSPGLPMLVRNLSMPLVSVIIPLYNKAAHIEETLRSVIADQYPNKEIIVVDDASTDHSAEIVERVASECGQVSVVRLVHNVGLSGCRNAGLSAANGEFIHFWDADDIYSTGALAKIVKIMLEDDCDIATGLAHRNGDLLSHYAHSNQLCRRTSLLANPMAFTTTSSCFKVYSKAFLDRHQLAFVDRLFMQDLEFNFRAFIHADCISVTPYVLGDYRWSVDSSSRVFNLARMESAIRIDGLTRSFLDAERRPEFEALRQRQVMHFAFLFFIRRLIGLVHTESTTEYAHVTEQFRSIVRGYREGILELGQLFPRSALLLAAFGSGHDDICRQLQVEGERARSKYVGAMLHNPLSLSVTLLEGIFDRAFPDGARTLSRPPRSLLAS